MMKTRAILEQIRKNPLEKHDPLLLSGMMVLPGAVDGLSIDDVLVIVKRVGLGTHAEVYEARLRDCSLISQLPNLALALKVEKPLRQFGGLIKSEIEIFKSNPTCTSLPRFLGEFEVEIDGNSCIAFAMEMFNDTVSVFKHSQKFKSLNIAEKLQVLDFLSKKVFLLIHQLHVETGFLHRDIKPSNIMYKLSTDNDVRFALVDMGSAIPIGKRNNREFKGTGAYTSMYVDVMQSQRSDDMWAGVFSLLDLCVAGGLPWRSISGRSEEGRATILEMKKNFLQSLHDTPSADVEEKVIVPETITEVIEILEAHHLDHLAGRDMSNAIFSESFVNKLSIDSGSVSVNLLSTIKSVLYPPDMKLDTKGRLPKSDYMQCRNRNLIQSLQPATANCSVLFSVPTPGNLTGPQVLLHAFMNDVKISARNSVSVEGVLRSVCMAELITGDCTEACPLYHIPPSLAKPALIGFFSKNKICLLHFIDGVCSAKGCSAIHLSQTILQSVYVDGRVPDIVQETHASVKQHKLVS